MSRLDVFWLLVWLSVGVIIGTVIKVALGDVTTGDCAPSHEMRRALMNEGYAVIWRGRNDDDEEIAVWQTPSAMWLTTARRVDGRLCVTDAGWRAVKS